MRRNVLPLRWRPIFRAHIRTNLNRASIRAESTQTTRIDRITARLPRRLQRYTNGLRNAPVSHIVSFLILHEITAIVPVVGLFGLFHYTDHVPVSYMTDHFGSYVQEGLARFERYFKRKGWFGFGEEESANIDAVQESQNVLERWQSGDGRYKVVVEVALAYAITKALLPIRIIGSVWATPWFAGILMRAKSAVTRRS